MNRSAAALTPQLSCYSRYEVYSGGFLSRELRHDWEVRHVASNCPQTLLQLP